jgi:hypothetical protein
VRAVKAPRPPRFEERAEALLHARRRQEEANFRVGSVGAATTAGSGSEGATPSQPVAAPATPSSLDAVDSADINAMLLCGLRRPSGAISALSGKMY